MPSINDNFADAVEVAIAVDGGTYTSPAVDTAGNTTEGGEPAVSASADVSAWWKYTPASSGTASFDTQLSTPTGSGTDTYLAIWTGTALNNLVNVASDDDSGGSATSLISGQSVTAGTTYWIQVGGFGLMTMNVVVRVTGPKTGAAAAPGVQVPAPRRSQLPAPLQRLRDWSGPPIPMLVWTSPSTVAAVDLSIDDATHGQTVDDAAILTQVHLLTVGDALHSHAADSPALTQAHQLTVADAAHAQAADSPALTQSHLLAAHDAAHSQTADEVTLTQVHVLAVDDSTHGHAADQPTLTVGGISLVVQEASHGQTADSVALTQDHQLVVQDAGQAHTADQPALTQTHLLQVADTAHGQAADQPTLSQTHQLTVQDGLHGHTADNVTIVVGGIDLVVHDATQQQTVDSVTLAQAHALAVNDATQQHAADQVALSQTHILVVLDAHHQHTADSVTLTALGARRDITVAAVPTEPRWDGNHGGRRWKTLATASRWEGE